MLAVPDKNKSLLNQKSNENTGRAVLLSVIGKRKLKIQGKIAIITHHAPVAQLDRALDYESKG